MEQVWEHKAFCVVTGASRGFGKSIAIEFSKSFIPGSTFVLVGRHTSALEETETRKEILKGNESHQVHILEMDLRNPCREKFKQACLQWQTEPSHHHAIIVHSAGTTGNLRQFVCEYENLEEMNEYFALEVSAMLMLNSSFLKTFDIAPRKTIVSITSELSFTPFKYSGMYCAGKAARDILMKCIALEEGDRVEVVNYDPTTIETEMTQYAVEQSGNPEFRGMVDELRATGKILKPEVPAKHLVNMIREKSYVSGERIAYQAQHNPDVK